MPIQADDLLLSLQTSLRNALSTFGPESTQYRSIKLMVDEHMTKLALERLSLLTSESKRPNQDVMQTD
ncbi:hypothetical protein J1614_009356 [Plenodomus biglobosus]|nr:hypothetical protein J1614_009356 [Plenodomus biglobosus]